MHYQNHGHERRCCPDTDRQQTLLTKISRSSSILSLSLTEHDEHEQNLEGHSSD